MSRWIVATSILTAKRKGPTSSCKSRARSLRSFLEQGQQPLVQAAVLRFHRGETLGHDVEPGGEIGEFGRTPGLGEPRAVIARADAAERHRQARQRPQRPAERPMDQQERRTAEQGDDQQGVAELAPDLADLVVRIRPQRDRAMHFGVGRKRDGQCRESDAEEPVEPLGDDRRGGRQCGEQHRDPVVVEQRRLHVTVAVEAADQPLEVASRAVRRRPDWPARYGPSARSRPGRRASRSAPIGRRASTRARRRTPG